MEIEDPAAAFARLAVELRDISVSGVVETAQTVRAVRSTGDSQDTNTKLRDVAQVLIDTRKLPTMKSSEAAT